MSIQKTIVILFTFIWLTQATESLNLESKSFYNLETKHEMDKNVKSKLSSLWTVVMLNMLTADILSLYIPGVEDEMAEFAGGEDDISKYMVGAAIMMEVPISMIFLSRVLPNRANRAMNIGAAALTAAFVIGGASKEPHYIVIAGAELTFLSIITYQTLKWRKNEKKLLSENHDVSLNVNPINSTYGLTYSYKF